MRTPSSLLLVLVLAACGGRSGVLAGRAPDTVAYSMKDASRSEGSCRSVDSAKTPMPCLQVTLQWPEVADSSAGVRPAKEFIERLVHSSFKNGQDAKTTDSVVTEISALRALMTQSHKQGYDVPWLAERKVTVACNEPGRFGIRLVSNQFLGGTHAMSATRYANFDTRTGKSVALEEVLAPGKMRALKEAAMAAYSRRQGVNSVADLKLEPDSFPAPRSVLACGDSLVLQYDVLAFGPHRSIDVEIAVDKASAAGLLR